MRTPRSSPLAHSRAMLKKSRSRSRMTRVTTCSRTVTVAMPTRCARGASVAHCPHHVGPSRTRKNFLPKCTFAIQSKTPHVPGVSALLRSSCHRACVRCPSEGGIRSYACLTMSPCTVKSIHISAAPQPQSCIGISTFSPFENRDYSEELGPLLTVGTRAYTQTAGDRRSSGQWRVNPAKAGTVKSGSKRGTRTVESHSSETKYMMSGMAISSGKGMCSNLVYRKR